jgi:prepilin-type N-terminal cleavage/methylation domain-containing protein/prepilin-type processing-associated H-X9-DG protein
MRGGSPDGGDRGPIARTAFTLVELLVVVAVIATLSGLVLPTFWQAHRLGARTACRGNLRTVAVGLQGYLNFSHDVMPLAAQMPSQKLNDAPRIADVLKPYLGQTACLQCPADRDRNYFASEGSSYEYQSLLGGRTVDQGFLTSKLGPSLIPVMNDYEPFHGRPGTGGAMNYLFADSHVGDLKSR